MLLKRVIWREMRRSGKDGADCVAGRLDAYLPSVHGWSGDGVRGRP
jgi:hypothetical protein